MPVLGLRRSARALRRAGKRKTSAGAKTAPSQSIGNASLLGALADIFCVNFFLAWIGLQVIILNNTVVSYLFCWCALILKSGVFVKKYSDQGFRAKILFSDSRNVLSCVMSNGSLYHKIKGNTGYILYV